MATAAMFAGFWGGVFGAGTVAAGVAAAVTAIVINVAIAYVLGKILAPSFNDSRDVQGMQDTVRNNIMPRRVVYGQAVVGGPLLYYESTGTDNNFLHLAIALTGHPVEDIFGIFINDEYVRSYGLAASPFDSDNHNNVNNDLDVDWYVDAGLYNATTESGARAARFIKNTGWGFADHQYVTDETLGHVTADQARAELVATILGVRGDRWTLGTSVKNTRDTQTGIYTAPGRKLTNCAWAYTRFAFDREIWQGFPRVRFHVKGKRLYNPYKDPALAAYGADSSGTHSLYDPDTWEWSEDWTLCVLDYLLNSSFGLAARASTNPDEIDNVLYNEIDWEQVIESYLVSSEIVSKGTDTGTQFYGSGVGPRYTVNGVFEVDATPVSIMDSLLACGAGKLIYSQGKYRIRAGYYKAPASEQDIINEDMIVGPMLFQSHTPRSDLFNKAGGNFINAGYDLENLPATGGANKPEFVNDQFPLVDPKDSSGTNPYEVQDGEPLIREFDFPFVIRSWEAQRLAKIYLERIRRGITVQFKATLDIMKYSVGDTVYLEILNNSKYSSEVFFNKLGLDDQVQTQDTPKTSPYYKQFMIMEMNYNEDYTVDVVLLEEQQEIYDWNHGDASPDTGDLGSEVPIISPNWPVLPPTFNVPSPGAAITETSTATGINTLVYFTTDENLSIGVEYLDRPFIKEYILQYGEVTSPGQSSAVDRVGTWVEAGRFTPTNRTLDIQGPISIPDIYIDPNTDYDFRIRGVADDNRLSAWTYYSDEAGLDWTPSEPTTAARYYILPTNGTAIKDGTGTLTVEARQVSGSGDVLLSSGDKKLYVGATEVTVANGFASPSDGYTGTFDAGDITESVVVELRDDVLGFTYDTITLVDILDGAAGTDATVGYAEVDGPYSWIDQGNGVYTPSPASTQINVTFVRGGTEVARTARTINKNSGLYYQIDQLSDGGAATHPSGNLNTGSISVNVSITGVYKDQATVTFTYNESPYNSFTVSQDITAAVIGIRYYILPINGTVIKNGTGTLTVEARRLGYYSGDELLTSGSYKLYVGSNEVTVANGFASPSDGYTGTFDSGDINGSVEVELRNDVIGTTYDVVTLADLSDGDPGQSAVVGYIESDNGLAWRKAQDGGAWTPATTTTDLDCTFSQGGSDVARVAYRLTLNTGDGTITGSSTTHTGGDLNTGRVTITEIPSGLGTENATIQFTYSFGGDVVSVSETVFSVIGGSQGSAGVVASLSVSSPYVTSDADGTTYSFNNPTSEFRLFDGATDVTDDTSVTYTIVESSTTTHTINGLQITVSDAAGAGKGEISFADNPSWSTSREQFTVRANYNGVNYDLPISLSKVNKGAIGGIVFLSTNTHTISANPDGTGYTLPSNPVSQMTVYANNVDVTDTTGCNFSVNSPDTVDGLTASISNSIGTKGQISLSGTWTGTQASFTFTATYDGVSYEQTYTITKSLAGAEPITINYSNSSHSVPVDNLGNETWTGSGGLLRVLEGGTFLTLATNAQTNGHTGLSNGEFQVDITPVSGNTLNEPVIPSSDTGTTFCSLGEWSGGLTGITVYRLNVYIQDTLGVQHTRIIDITLTPSVEGSDGASVDVIFKRSQQQPATPSPSAGVPVTWYGDVDSVPAGTDPIWSSFGQRASGQTNYTWQTPVRIEASNTLYVRGTGANNNSNRIVRVSGTDRVNGAGRGFCLSVMKRSDLSEIQYRRDGTGTGTLAADQVYDTYASDPDRTALKNALVELRTNSNTTLSAGEWGEDIFIVITSYDANNLATGAGGLLINELLNHGAKYSSLSRFNAATYRIPYLLIGIPGIGEYNGIEIMTDDGATTPPAEYFGVVNDGTLPGLGASLGLDSTLGWSHSLTFSVTSPTDTTVAWTGGSIKLPNGKTYSISPGNTGTMSARTYIYLDTDVSTTALQTTTTATNAVGRTQLLIAVAENSTNTDSDAYFQVFGGAGGLMISADNIAADTITANNIKSGNYYGVTFTGATFQTRDPDSATAANNPRALVSSSGFELYVSGPTSPYPDSQVFSVGLDGNNLPALNIDGNILSGKVDQNIFSAAGLIQLRDALGVTQPTGGSTGGNIINDLVPIGLSGSTVAVANTINIDNSSPYQYYVTKNSEQTITFTIRDSDWESFWSQNPFATNFTQPSWDCEVEYAYDNTGDPNTPTSGWLAIPGGLGNFPTITTQVNVNSEPMGGGWYLVDANYSLNVTKTIQFTPTAPTADTDYIYYRLRITRNSGSYNIPRITLFTAAEQLVSPSDTLEGLEDTTISTPSTGQILIYDGTNSWDNKSMSGHATINSSGALTIASNVIGATQLNVSGNGTSTQYLRSDGDGSFTWATPSGSIGGSIAQDQVAVGAITANNIEGSSGLIWDGSSLKVTGSASGVIYLNDGNTTGPSSIQGIWFRDSANTTYGELTHSVSGVTLSASSQQVAVVANAGSSRFIIDATDIMLHEQSSPSTQATNYGQFWVRNDAPNTPWFRGDTGIDLPLGFNAAPPVTVSAGQNFLKSQVGNMLHVTTASITLTCAVDSTTWNGATWIVHNDSTGSITIGTSGTTLYWIEGGSAPSPGNVTVQQGGIVTIYKKASTEFWAWGSKEAGGGTGIGGSIANDQIAFGAATSNQIEGSSNLTFNGTTFQFNSTNFGQFIIDRLSTTGGAAVCYQNNDGVKGYAGFNDAGEFVTYDTVPTETGFSVSSGGVVTATSFSGSGSGLTSIPAASISAGSLPQNVNSFFVTSTGNNNYKIPFMNYTGTGNTNASMLHDSTATFTYNPSSNTLIVSNLNTTYLDTQVNTGTGNTSGASVLDHGATPRDVGFNDLRLVADNPASVAVAEQHIGGCIFADDNTGFTVTLPTSTSSFPVGGVVTIVNANSTGNITVSDAGASYTLFYLDGSTRTDVLTSCTVGPGGVATLMRTSATGSTTPCYVIWGSGITP